METNTAQGNPTSNNEGSDKAIVSERSDTPKYLDFVTNNTDRSVTILLIHGAAASGTDWALVVPHLSSYHLLIPSYFTNPSLDLVRKTRQRKPSSASDISPSRRWDACFAFHLAELVKAHAKGGRAHIVGLSLGGCLSVKLLATYPEICLSVFVSGLPTMISTSFYPIAKPIGTGLMWATHCLTRSMGHKKMGTFLDSEVDIDTGFWDGKGGGATVEMNGILTEIVVHKGSGEHYATKIRGGSVFQENDDRSQPFRFGLVAATRRNKWTPTADSSDWAVEVVKTLLGEKSVLSSEKGPIVQDIDCRVYEGERMFHPWSRQFPELFARCILATVQGTDFPNDGLDEVWKH